MKIRKRTLVFSLSAVILQLVSCGMPKLENIEEIKDNVSYETTIERGTSTVESITSQKTDTAIFGIMVFAVIFIIAALSFFPALALGPLAEYFTI